MSCYSWETNTKHLHLSLCLTCPNPRLSPSSCQWFSPGRALCFLYHLHFLQQVTPELLQGRGQGKTKPRPSLLSAKINFLVCRMVGQTVQELMQLLRKISTRGRDWAQNGVSPCGTPGWPWEQCWGDKETGSATFQGRSLQSWLGFEWVTEWVHLPHSHRDLPCSHLYSGSHHSLCLREFPSLLYCYNPCGLSRWCELSSFGNVDFSKCLLLKSCFHRVWISCMNTIKERSDSSIKVVLGGNFSVSTWGGVLDDASLSRIGIYLANLSHKGFITSKPVIVVLEKKEERKCCEHSVNGLDLLLCLFSDSNYFLNILAYSCYILPHSSWWYTPFK